MAWAVMDLVIAGANGLGLSLPERHAIAAINAEEPNPSALFQQDRDVTIAR